MWHEAVLERRRADAIDAHVALMTAPADLVLTSDPGDIRQLLQARRVPARIQHV